MLKLLTGDTIIGELELGTNKLKIGDNFRVINKPRTFRAIKNNDGSQAVNPINNSPLIDLVPYIDAESFMLNMDIVVGVPRDIPENILKVYLENTTGIAMAHSMEDVKKVDKMMVK